MSTPSKRILAYAEIRVLGATCNFPSGKSEFTSRKVVFFRGRRNVLQNCAREKIVRKSELAGA